MNLTKFFINNIALLICVAFIFLTGGIFSYINLERNEDPGFIIRTASIVTEAPRLNAEQVDEYITRPIEKYLYEMEEIEDIRSESLSGRSVIYADLYEKYKNIQPIWDRLRRKVEKAKNSIPQGLTPIVNDEYGDVFGALIGVSILNDEYEKLYDICYGFKNEFLKLDNVGKAEIFGQRNEAVYVWFKNSYFVSLNLTVDYLKKLFQNSNMINGGGKIKTKTTTIEISPEENFKSENDIKNTFLNISGKAIRADDVFDIKKTTETPPSILVRSNGRNALILGLTLKDGGNILKWGKEIKNKVNELKKENPECKIEILALQSEYVKTLVDKFSSGLFESVLIVIGVVLLIIGLKSGLITGFIILIVISSTFFVMDKANIGLDKISLSALIISLGILVDNSIVIAQGLLTANKLYNDKKELLLNVSGKFQLPLLVTSLTTSLAFLPVILAKSAVGEYAASLFKVVFITLFFSWFYSISLLPYLMFKFTLNEKKENKEFFIVSNIKIFIEKALKKPKIVVPATLIFFLISIILFNFLPKIFFPDSDRNSFEIRLNFKNGTAFDVTKSAIQKCERYLKKEKDVVNFSSYIGMSAPRYVLSASPESNKTNFGMLLVNTKSYKTINKNIKDAKKFINKNIENAEAVVRKIPLGPPVNAPVEIRIINKDKDKLFENAKFVTEELNKIKGVYLVKKDWGDFILSYNIKLNENAAIMAGFSGNYALDYINTIYEGEELTNYYRNDIKIPVILKMDSEFASDPDKIGSIAMYSIKTNGFVPLKQIVEITPKYTYAKILRRNNFYVLTVQGWIEEGATADKVIKEIIPKLNRKKGLAYEIGGSTEKSKKGNKSITEGIPIAFSIILLILIAYFKGIKKPLMIGLCAIMALGGANFGLFITGCEFGFMTFLGYICLVGICVNNGVILLSEIKNDTVDEVINAAKSRVEPVLLTCLTTVGGMLPLWIKNDPMFSSLAVAIIFGLFSSIMITLFCLPSFYIISIKKQDFLQKI